MADDAFLTNALTGSLDGEFYRQDKVTVLAGKWRRCAADRREPARAVARADRRPDCAGRHVPDGVTPVTIAA